MDLHHLSILFGLVAAVAICAVAWLIWRDERDARRRQVDLARRMQAVQREIAHRPRVPAITTPLPTVTNMKGTST